MIDRSHAVGVLCVSLLLAAGCGKNSDDAKTATAKTPKAKTPGTTAAKVPAPNPPGEDTEKRFRDDVVALLKKAGLEPGSFDPAAALPYAASHCARGEINKLDVIVCEFSGDAALKAGQKKLEQFVKGAISGAVRRSKSQERVLAVADRHKNDLKGERINKLIKAFAKL
jgi:hypothetical protein